MSVNKNKPSSGGGGDYPLPGKGPLIDYK